MKLENEEEKEPPFVFTASLPAHHCRSRASVVAYLLWRGASAAWANRRGGKIGEKNGKKIKKKVMREDNLPNTFYYSFFSFVLSLSFFSIFLFCDCKCKYLTFLI